ncbi:M48 family metalloprotease [Crenalkalicoccus roseus]|uniref:M48 family metalloprotease n=1 Tax=Crenalkalicoccus roseus TaxID=1485588 RepID=UPI001081E66A|nr:M48 family metalloprotease [Crenalkalicoccus roseus]
MLGRFRPILFLAGVSLAGCGPQFAFPEPGRAELVTAQQQLAAAAPLREHDRSVAEQQAMLRRVASRVAAAAQPFCEQYRGQRCAFRVAYDPSPQVNAYAAGQGDVAVTAGLLRIVDNDSQLAAVVAHEFAHHVAGHIGRAQARTTLGALAGAVIGSAAGLGDLSALGAGAARLVYSQAEEREADYLAAFIVARAGYDLEEAGGIWARLAASGDRRVQAGLLDTHPAGPERLAAWQAAMREIAASPDAMPRRLGAR